MPVIIDGQVHGLGAPNADKTLCGLPLPTPRVRVKQSVTCERCIKEIHSLFLDGWRLYAVTGDWHPVPGGDND